MRQEHPAPQENTPMRTLLGLVILFVLFHGFNTLVLKIIGAIKSALKYWRETSKQ
jgi:hypothetical protein